MKNNVDFKDFYYDYLIDYVLNNPFLRVLCVMHPNQIFGCSISKNDVSMFDVCHDSVSSNYEGKHRQLIFDYDLIFMELSDMSFDSLESVLKNVNDIALRISQNNDKPVIVGYSCISNGKRDGQVFVIDCGKPIISQDYEMHDSHSRFKDYLGKVLYIGNQLKEENKKKFTFVKKVCK